MSEKITVALIFPSSLREGGANLGFNSVFKWINSNPDFLCDRFFYEEGRVVNYDSKRNISQYHIIAFSISFFNDYLKIPHIIRKINLPLLASERKDTFPLVIGGGNALTLNPEPVAEIFDAIVIGDAEPVINFLLETISSIRNKKKTKILEKLNENPHIYIPSIKKQVKIAVSDLKHAPSVSRYGDPELAIKNAGLVETGRGCRWKCRFCPIGYAYLPPRFYSVDDILKSVCEIKDKKVGLIAPVITDHPEIEKILREILKMGKEVTVSSLRIEGAEASFLSLISNSQRTITIAPETGSERLRRKINKPVSEIDIFKLIDSIPEGIKKVRCYIMIGIPEETTDDIKETARMLKEIKLLLSKKGKGMDANVNPFVPVPHTPFQWFSIESKKDFEAKINLLRKEIVGTGIKLKVKSYREAKLEEVLAKGGRNVLRKIVYEPHTLLKTTTQNSDTLPWDFIISPAERSSLKMELDMSEKGITSLPCERGCLKCQSVKCKRRNIISSI